MSSVYYLISNWVAEWEHWDFLCRHFYRSSNWKLTMNQSLRRGGSSFLTDKLASIRMYISVVECMFESETWYIVWRYAELRKWYEWSLLCIRRNIFVRKNWRWLDDSGPNHLLDGVSRQGVEEHGEEEGEEDDEDDLEDCPLVVVPDDVPDRLQRVQEPHERWIRSPGNGKVWHKFMFSKKLIIITSSPLSTQSSSYYVGFSRALGSSLPSPAGCFSASSPVIRISSASTWFTIIRIISESFSQQFAVL